MDAEAEEREMPGSTGWRAEEEENCKSNSKYIKFVKLDNYTKDFSPNIIKYDVEGAEIEALKGSKKTIYQYQPELCISIYHKHDHLYKIPFMINSWKLNYETFQWEAPTPMPDAIENYVWRWSEINKEWVKIATPLN